MVPSDYSFMSAFSFWLFFVSGFRGIITCALFVHNNWSYRSPSMGNFPKAARGFAGHLPLWNQALPSFSVSEIFSYISFSRSKWKWPQSCPTLWPRGLYSPSRPAYWNWYPFPSPRDLPNPWIEPRSPTLQADSLPAEPQGKPKNTGVDSLSFLQFIFLTQKLNQSLPYCRQILY